MQFNTSSVVYSNDYQVTAKRRRFEALNQRVYYDIFQIIQLNWTIRKSRSCQNHSKLILIYRDFSNRTPSIL